eukprot:scaffold11105_cov70-Skeletonema_marinoi.AAC.1
MTLYVDQDRTWSALKFCVMTFLRCHIEHRAGPHSEVQDLHRKIAQVEPISAPRSIVKQLISRHCCKVTNSAAKMAGKNGKKPLSKSASTVGVEDL